MVSTKSKAIFAMLGMAVLGTSAMAAPSLSFTEAVSAVYDPSNGYSTVNLASLNLDNTQAKTYLYRITISVQYVGTTTNPWITACSAQFAPSSESGGTLGGLKLSLPGVVSPDPATTRQGYQMAATPKWWVSDGADEPQPAQSSVWTNQTNLQSLNPDTGVYGMLLNLGDGKFFDSTVSSTDATQVTGADYRQTMAQSSPLAIGYVFAFWDGQEKQTFTLINTDALVYNSVTTQIDSGVTSTFANTVTFGANIAVPEPASLGVLALGGLALLARRRKAA
jgi:hypothetical protein